MTKAVVNNVRAGTDAGVWTLETTAALTDQLTCAKRVLQLQFRYPLELSHSEATSKSLLVATLWAKY